MFDRQTRWAQNHRILVVVSSLACVVNMASAGETPGEFLVPPPQNQVGRAALDTQLPALVGAEAPPLQPGAAAEVNNNSSEANVPSAESAGANRTEAVEDSRGGPSPESITDPALTYEQLLQRLEESEKRIQEILDQGLKKQADEAKKQAADEEKKQAEEAKKKAAEDAGFEVGADLGMIGKWNNGLEFSTKDKAFRIHIGGRTQFDTGWYVTDRAIAPPDINNPYRDGVDFRRARLRIDGTMYEQQEFAIEYDFVNSVRANAGAGTTDFDVTAFTDAWWQLKSVPVVGNVRIGNQKEAIGFEHLVSSRYLPFMERSYNQDAFYGGSFNGFSPGIAVFDQYDEGLGSWNIGLYKPTNNVFAVNAWEHDVAVTGRLTKLLWYEAEGADLVHIGLGARYATSVQDRVRFRTRDAVRSGISVQWPIPADTGSLLADGDQMLDPELAIVRGPWTFQAEYLANWTQNVSTLGAAPITADNLFYQGYYVQAFYFLTGEHENYSQERGAFDRVKPRENFFALRGADGCTATGWGAWQVGARYNFLDLNNQGINGGELHNLTTGLNWFWNPNMKVQLNYTATYRDSPLAAGAGDGWIHALGLRLAHDF